MHSFHASEERAYAVVDMRDPSSCISSHTARMVVMAGSNEASCILEERFSQLYSELGKVSIDAMEKRYQWANAHRVLLEQIPIFRL